MRIVFDTNIYVSAALNQGLCNEILNQAFEPDRGWTLLISKSILEEIRKKLKYFREQKLVTHKQIEIILKTVTTLASLIEPKEKIKAVKRDPGDNIILECAVAARADLIVTMDKDLLKIKNFRNIGIVHPIMLTYMFEK